VKAERKIQIERLKLKCERVILRKDKIKKSYKVSIKNLVTKSKLKSSISLGDEKGRAKGKVRRYMRNY